MRLAIILAEFGKPAPDVSQYRECWPDADIRIITDADVPPIPQFDGPRYGWRMNDLHKVRALLDSKADVAISFDSDMRILDRTAARTLPLLAEKFGICLPMNPRYTVDMDTRVGADSDRLMDETRGTGPSVNCSPIALNLNDARAVLLAEAYCCEMLSCPQRGPLVWWRAMMATGISPLILPPQWCTCEVHIGIGGEIAIHEGHDSVKRHYALR